MGKLANIVHGIEYVAGRFVSVTLEVSSIVCSVVSAKAKLPRLVAASKGPIKLQDVRNRQDDWHPMIASLGGVLVIAVYAAQRINSSNAWMRLPRIRCVFVKLYSLESGS